MGLIDSLLGVFSNPASTSDDVVYDDDVDYETLEQHTYADSGNSVFYTCPKYGGEYLATFIVEENGETMCIDCAS